MEYIDLKDAVKAVIKENGNEEITGQSLQDVLLAIINSLGTGYQFVGVGTPETTPGTPDAKVMYLCTQSGTYTNFGTPFTLDGKKIALCLYGSAWENRLLPIPTSEALAAYLAIADLATGTGDSEQTTMTQRAISEALGGKADETVLQDYAKKIGYYEQFRAGLADNLFSPISVIQKYLFGPSAEGNEVASGAAFLRAFKGNGAAWNQLVENGNFDGASGWGTYNCTLTASNNTATVTTSGSAAVYQNIAIVSGHKYLRIFEYKGPAGTIRFYTSSLSGSINASNFSASDSWVRYTNLVIASANAAQLALNVSSGETQFRNVMLIDLTALGIDTLTTVAQVEEWRRKQIGERPYYADNAGTLLGAKLKGFKSWKTANLLDPETKTARLFEYTYGEAVNKYTIQELPNDAALYFTPDATGVEVAVTMDDTTHFSVSGQGTLAVKTSDGSAAYAGDVSEVWLVAYYDGAMDSYDNYKPFAQDVKSIDAGKIYYDNAGTKTKVWADGVMRAASPSVQDELRYDDLASKWKASVRAGKYTFTGQESWTDYGASGGKGLNLGDIINADTIDGAATPVLMTDTGLPVTSRNAIYNAESGGISINNHIIFAADATKCSAGKKIAYKLATPLTYDTLYYSEDGETFVPLEDVLSPDLLVNNWAAQEVEVSDYVDGNPTAVTLEVEIEYMEDAVEALKTYKDEAVLIEDQHDQVQAVLEALKTANIISAYTLADAPTSGTKVFAVSVTKYTEE